MKDPRRIQTNICPPIIQRLGNGTYYYNYDIQVLENSIDEEPQYIFIQVLLSGQPNYEKCVKEIVRSYLTVDEEFDLINSYNSYMQNITEDEKAVQEYKDYLNLLSEIKQKVKEDFSKI